MYTICEVRIYDGVLMVMHALKTERKWRKCGEGEEFDRVKATKMWE